MCRLVYTEAMHQSAVIVGASRRENGRPTFVFLPSIMSIQNTANEVPIQVGHPAPDFTLTSHDKQPVTLSEQRGKNVILLFFPAAFTSVCTDELCNVRDNQADYNDLNAQVYGISVDMPFTLAEFGKQQGLTFPLLSDFNKEVSTAYGSLYDTFAFGMKGVSKRSAFVIDKDGIVRYAEVLENAGEQPSFENIRATLTSLN